MAASADPVRFQMPRPVARKIGRLRFLVRLYALLEGVAVLLLLLGMAFWLALAVDWLLEPSREMRIMMWGVVLVASLWIAVQLLFRRVFARLPKSGIALVLERQFPQLQESLVTTVEFAEKGAAEKGAGGERMAHRSGHAAEPTVKSSRDFNGESASSPELFRPVMLRQTSQLAAKQIARIPLRRVLRIRPLAWKGLAAVCMVLSIAGFAAAYHDQFDFWLQRLQLDEAPWPRRVQLEVFGFETLEGGQRIALVARDDDYVLHVQASIIEGHELPETVEIRYRLADGRRGRDTMTRVGEALPGRDPAQRYRYQFKHVVSDLDFEILGGDDRVENLHLRVVERPQVVLLSVGVEYPAYLQREPRSIEVGGRLELPEGASATCRVEVSKPLQSVHIDTPDNLSVAPGDASDASTPQRSIDVEVSPPGEESRLHRRGEFHFQLDDVRQDRVLLITMRDEDGIENREPYRLLVAVIHDEVPDVAVGLRGIGSAVTSQATLPFSGQITDEYGLERVWFEYRLDQGAPGQREMQLSHPGSRQFSKLEPLDLAETDPATVRPLLELKPGQKLSLSIRARDAYDLLDQPHLGASQQFLLDVVTPSELRAILEKQELTLRQRFEAIYEKLAFSRDLLDRIEGIESSATRARDTAAGETPSSQGEPAEHGVNKRTSTPISTRRRREANRLRVMSVLQNVTQLAYETLGVADGFEDIVAELVNNRINTRELTQRLQQQIAIPLQAIGGQQMPVLETQLQTFQAALDESVFPMSRLREARKQTDAVLVAMKGVLDRMLELESYNEIVKLLRGIIAEQQQLSDETKAKQRTRLRGLLEE
jgi:hypothetical protein